MADLAKRFAGNPILSPKDIASSHPDLEVACVLNPGVFSYADKIWLIARVAERPVHKEGLVQVPIIDPEGFYATINYERDDQKLDCHDVRYVIYDGMYYLSTISHFVLLCSDNGLDFYEPQNYWTRIFGEGVYESYGIEDCRVTEIDGMFHLTYTQVSPNGVTVGHMSTDDWKSFNKSGIAFLPANKDCTIFTEKINNKYYCLNRPSSLLIGGNYIWISSSPDLIHWGEHHCLIKSRPGMWDSERVGAGAAPIRTKSGWLAIYHGADASHRYCLGAILLDIDDPRKILARSVEPIMEPIMEYEQQGFFGNVVFTNGHLVDGDQLIMYYGASDSIICKATFSIREILDSL